MKKTKKNWVMRIALLVLVLTLGTACIVSGTYAKYVTTDTGADTARVAKWGVTITAAKKGDNGILKVKGDNGIVLTGDQLVAPGTTGTALAFQLTGTPEVAVKIAIDATRSTIGKALQKGTTGGYEPIVWKVGADPVVDPTVGDKKPAGSFAALQAFLARLSFNINAGKNLAQTGNCYITWEWVFTQGNDAADTAIANAMANPGAYRMDTATGAINTNDVSATNVKLEENDFKINLNFVVSVTQEN